MTEKKKTICVYCSSSNGLPAKFYDFAEDFGINIAKNGYDMVYGGTIVGMMGVIANNALNYGAEVTGVIPEKIASYGLKNPKLANIIITKEMRERKAVMERLSDIFVALPGGFGTFEEIFEIMVAKQLGYHNKPVIFFNFDNFYDNMFKMFDKIYENNFAKESVKNLYYITDDIQDMYNYLKHYEPCEFVLKW